MTEFLIAFFSGMLVILSPCILPIVPIVLSASLGKSKLKPVWITLGLVIGFTILGIVIGTLGSVINISRETTRLIGIILILLLGIFLLFPKLAHLLTNIFARLKLFKAKTQNSSEKWWNSLLLGFALGLVWTPCSIPIAVPILGLSFLEGSILKSIILTILFATGFAIPLLVIGYLGNTLVNQINWLKKHLLLIQKIAGSVIIIVGIMMLFNLDQKIQRLFFT